MAAAQETLARLDGKPLLSEAGMAAVDALLVAHVDYDMAETMHSAEIAELSTEIKGLEARRAALCNEARAAVNTQHKARHNHSFDVIEAVANPKNNANPVYATVLKAIASDGQSGLWYPSTLEVADEMGRSLVEFDQALRTTHRAQPALVIDRERSGHTGVYVAKTKLRGHLSPATIPIEERRRYTSITTQRDALALPVNEKRIVGLQIHPNTFGSEESLADYSYDRGPKLRELIDSFKILLPQGSLSGELARLGSYDTPDGTADIKVAPEFMARGTIEFAIGKLSVRKALADLRQEFAQKSDAPDRLVEQQLAFDQLTQLAMGEIKLARRPSERLKRVRTNFAQV